MNGIAYLVGAGPGDPGLLTRKGAEVLQRADVVLYDHLGAAEFLREIPAHTERICVGKRAGDHTVAQSEIGRILCERVRAGQCVVRLKGGDPFVFGRGGEEALALAEANLPFEIVPGVTSGIAAPAYAGIPVTHRHLSVGVAFVTGHEDPTKEHSDQDWASLARSGLTLCIYMGVGRIATICAALQEGGRPADEPAALIEWGCTPRQRTVTGTLATLPECIEQAGLQPPALCIVGDVVSLREQLCWRESQPLFGTTVLITRPAAQARSLQERIERTGGQTQLWPAVEIEQNTPAAAEVIHSLQSGTHPDWIVFTSANGVDGFRFALEETTADARLLHNIRIAAIGPATADALLRIGIRPDLVPESYIAEALYEALVDACGDRISQQTFWLLRSDRARPALHQALNKAGATVQETVLYRTCPAKTMPEAIRSALVNREIDAITFTSSSTAEGFAASLGSDLQAILAQENRPRFYSIGPITSETMRTLGLPIDAEAATHDIPGLMSTLLDGETRR